MSLSPFPARSRLSRSSLSTPSRGGSGSGEAGMPKSPSTPYDLYHQRTQSPLASSSSTPRSSSAFLPSSASQQHTLGAYRRNAGFGSPGVGRPTRYSQAGVGTSTESASPRPPTGAGTGPKAARFVRKKTLKQRAQELPWTVYDWIVFSPLLDFADPLIGYPAGLGLHFLSLVALSVHPDGPLHFPLTNRGATSTRTKGLFADQSGLAFKRRQAQDDAWRWLATMLAYSLLIVAFANAYHLFTATRRYHLWMKSASEKINSVNASLVEMPHAMDVEPDQSFADRFLGTLSRIGWALVKALLWILDQALHQLRQIPYLGVIIRFLFPPTHSRRRGQSSTTPLLNQMHAIDMWTAPDVQLRIFSLYSPLHGLFYILYLKSNRGFSHFVTAFALMAIASAQLVLLIQFYTNLIRDKNVVAGEVLHEYDEKFVKPRAMTVSRDASTMTDEAETSAAKRQSWINRRHSSDEDQGYSKRARAPSAKRGTARKPRTTAA